MNKGFSSAQNIVTTVQDYYDDTNAINFHKQAWGQDIHIGRYDLLYGTEADKELHGRSRIQRAAEKATELLLERAFSSLDASKAKDSTIMDVGSGQGKTARMAAKAYGCKVVCIDVSREFNAVNSELSAMEGLSENVIIPGERSFFDTGMPDESMDIVMSQEAFTHACSGLDKAIAEAARVLKPGGLLVFSDILQSDDADAHRMAEVYKVLGISSMASAKLYQALAEEQGLELVSIDHQDANVGIHYRSMIEVIESLRGSIMGVDDAFMDRMTTRYSAWFKAVDVGVVGWASFAFKKKL